MNTPAHLIFGLAAFGQADRKRVTTAALVGAMIPDLSLYLLAGWHLTIVGTDPQIVFGQLYFSDSWQRIFQIDNSAVLWGAGLLIGMIFRSNVTVALCGAALLHIGFDFPLHHDDGRAHFWPISDWVFESPVSYWDPAHYGRIVGAFEIALSLGLCAVLWRRFTHVGMRICVTALGLMELAPVIAFGIIFAGG